MDYNILKRSKIFSVQRSKFSVQKGFTLAEILVAMAVFLLIMGSATGLFTSAVRNQRRFLITQEILNQTSYALEYMGRTIRMARKDLSGDCIAAQTNYANPSGDSSIRFLDYDGKCREFSKEGTQLTEKRSDTQYAADFPSTGTPLTSASTNLSINSLKFRLSGETQGDELQPRVTIFLDIGGREYPGLKIQTTISQRQLDVSY